jgi:hypothetical protein
MSDVWTALILKGYIYGEITFSKPRPSYLYGKRFSPVTKKLPQKRIMYQIPLHLFDAFWFP